MIEYQIPNSYNNENKTMPTFILFLLVTVIHQASSQDLSRDRAVLLSLKQHWGSPPSLTSWSSNTSHCDWPGIECNSSSVTALHLPSKGINGTLPSSIAQLTDLVSIDLSQNYLSGTIPGEFFLMKRLQSWLLNGNRLNGSIPRDFKNLVNLRRLDMSKNSFSGSVPMEMFQMHQLHYLLLSYNTLSGELPVMMNMSELKELRMNHNHFNGTIPESLGKLASLLTLDLSDNQLSGDIVESVFHLRSENAWLCYNNFVGKIPFELLDHRYESKCVDHQNLCSDYSADSLPSCPSSLCSDHRVKPFLECEPKSTNYFVITMVETAGCGVFGFAILFYLARKCWLKRHDTIVATRKKIWPSSPKEEKKWKMTAFQRLNFNEIDILQSLTDENLIGSGGSGKVYRVFMSQAGTTVAVKSITNTRKSDHRLEKEFDAEIQTLGNIRHSNIVKLLCCIWGEEARLLVYEYFDNKSLDQWLHGKKKEIFISVGGDSSVTKLDWPKRLHVAIGVAQGLCYLHHHSSPPIIHRDIKSSNILLDSDFSAKIADFGLAKLLTTKHGGTEVASAVAGSFGYLAPEYAYTKKVNSKIDVYSFGVVLLELTTGREAVSRGDHMNLAGRAEAVCRHINALTDLLDNEIRDSIYLDQIITVFRLGVMCTSTSPSVRPSMKACLHILTHCRQSTPNI